MAKPLGSKSLLIRQAITAHPDKGNTAIADANQRLARPHGRQDQGHGRRTSRQQKQAMKKAGPPPPAPAPAEPAAKPARKKPGRKPGRTDGGGGPSALLPRRPPALWT